MNKGTWSVIVGSTFLGAIGIFVRFAGDSLQPMTQTFGRIFVSFILITLFNLGRNKLNKRSLHIKRKDIGYFILNGLVGFSLMASAFTLSVLNTSITNTYFLLYTAPVFATILSAIFLKEKIHEYVLVSILMGMVGLVFLFNPSNLNQNLLGNLFGLATGICFGSYFVITGYLGKSYNSTTITFWTQLFGSMGLFPMVFLFDRPPYFTGDLSGWGWIVAAGAAVLAGYYLLNYGLTKIKSSVGSILSLFEPLSAIFYGAIFFSEYPSITTLTGAGMLLVSIVYLTTRQQDEH